MIANKTSYYDEFWGAKIKDYDITLEEEYDGEVYDKVKELILNGEYDDKDFQEPIEVYDVDGNFYHILPFEWLNEIQAKFLSLLIELMENFDVIECGKEGKYYLIDIEENLPDGCKYLSLVDISDDYLEKIINEKDDRIFKR